MFGNCLFKSVSDTQPLVAYAWATPMTVWQGSPFPVERTLFIGTASLYWMGVMCGLQIECHTCTHTYTHSCTNSRQANWKHLYVLTLGISYTDLPLSNHKAAAFDWILIISLHNAPCNNVSGKSPIVLFLNLISLSEDIPFPFGQN